MSLVLIGSDSDLSIHYYKEIVSTSILNSKVILLMFLFYCFGDINALSESYNQDQLIFTNDFHLTTILRGFKIVQNELVVVFLDSPYVAQLFI